MLLFVLVYFLISIEKEVFKGLKWPKGTDFFSGKNPVWHLHLIPAWPLKTFIMNSKCIQTEAVLYWQTMQVLSYTHSV